MALATCPECKRQISTSAAACPACGYQRKRTNWMAIVVIVIVAIVAIVFGMRAIDSSS